MQDSQLTKFTNAAKHIIYNPQRMKAFLGMLKSKEGAVQAVHTVIGAIEKSKPVPAEILPMLMVNTYLVMVDVAQEVTGAKADPNIVREVVGLLLSQQGQQPQPQQQPTQPVGMLAQGA